MNEYIKYIIGKDNVLVWDSRAEKVIDIITYKDKSAYYARVRELLLLGENLI